jgi:hypothetical protein
MIEVFRIQPEVGEKCYEHAEATYGYTLHPSHTRYFTSNSPRYVGRFIKQVRWGIGDSGGARDYFMDNYGETQIVEYSYLGNTCFREVSCLPAVIPSLEKLCRNIVKQQFDYSSLPLNDPQRMIIESNF